MTYFRHNSFYFLSFQNSRQMCSGGQGGGRQGHGGVSHIGLKLKLKVEVFIVSVHGLEFKRSECASYYNIACQIQKDPIKNT